MGNVVAIGGGDNGWKQSKYETQVADKEIVKLTLKSSPVFLFIGFSANNPDEYFEIMNRIYSDLNCVCIHLDDSICKRGHAEELISKADIIYVAGGNTYKLMRRLRKYGLISLLEQKYINSSAVFCGVSAGGICWCKYGNSATRYDSNNNRISIRVKGIGFLDVLYCPHCTRDAFRRESMLKMLRRTPGLIGIEIDYAALEVIHDSFRVLNLDNRAVVRKIYYSRGHYFCRDISNTEFLPIELLYKHDGKEI